MAEIMESDVRQHVRNAGGHGERRHLVYAHAGPGGAGKSKSNLWIPQIARPDVTVNQTT